jgi:hypothetical protein
MTQLALDFLVECSWTLRTETTLNIVDLVMTQLALDFLVEWGRTLRTETTCDWDWD